MIDCRDLNYEETLQQISQLKEDIECLEKNINEQVPWGLAENFVSSKLTFLNWLEEIEFLLNEYESKK
jgi:hypothetical protein